MKRFTSSGEDVRLDVETRRELRGTFLTLPSGTTQAELTGPEEGELVVLIGGLTVPLAFWDRLVSGLHARGLRTLAYALYGRGYSDRVVGPYDERLFVRQLTELLGALELDADLHVVGTSMGALVGMAFAAAHPGVASLTLVSPAGLEQPFLPLHGLLYSDVVATFVARRFGRRMLERHMASEVLDPQLGEEVATMVREAFRCEGSMHAVFDTLQHFPLTARHALFRETAALELPTMLLWGDDDRVTPDEKLAVARGLLIPTESHRVAGCGHMPPIERPAEVADRIAAFVHTTSRSTP